MFKFFFNWLYKIKPPPMVKYWRINETSRAKIENSKDGSYKMYIRGEKLPFEGFPRGHVLIGPLSKLKGSIKNMIFNQVFSEIEKMSQDMKYDMLPPEKMSPAVKELWRVFEDMENAEVTPDMKGRIKLIKTVLCFFLQEDDAYRFRFQWMMPRFNMKKVKLSEADKYYFRGKYFKVDIDKFDY